MHREVKGHVQGHIATQPWLGFVPLSFPGAVDSDDATLPYRLLYLLELGSLTEPRVDLEASKCQRSYLPAPPHAGVTGASSYTGFDLGARDLNIGPQAVQQAFYLLSHLPAPPHPFLRQGLI